MAVLPILTFPDPVLKEESSPVSEINNDIKELAQDMIETMIAAPGSGLAAPQVGRSCRLIVVDLSQTREEQKPFVLVNPEILSADGEFLYEEACLSVVDYSAKVKRASSVTVRGLDLEGKPLEIQAEGRLAVVFQHEIDHLDGVLFIDRISALKRDLYRRRLKKLAKNQRVAE